MKRFIGGVISGSIVWGALLFAADLLAGWDLATRINWKSSWLWGSFALGFATALWFVMWFSLWRHLGSSSKESSDQAVSTSPTANAPVATPQYNNGYRVPSPMPVQTKAVMSVNPANPQSATSAAPAPVTVAPATTSPVPTSTAAPLSTTTPVEPPPSQKDRDILTLSALGQNLDMMAFKYVILQGKKIDLVFSSDDVAVLCKVLSDDTTWHVDITQPIENSIWTSDAGVITPGPELLAQAAILENMESNATIYPSIVLTRGKVQDYEQVQDFLLKNHINLVQYTPDQMPGVQTLEALLNDKFLTFPTDIGEPVKEETDGEG